MRLIEIFRSNELSDLKDFTLLCIQVTGQSFLLWAVDNYQNMCKLADEIVASEEVGTDYHG